MLAAADAAAGVHLLEADELAELLAERHRLAAGNGAGLDAGLELGLQLLDPNLTAEAEILGDGGSADRKGRNRGHRHDYLFHCLAPSRPCVWGDLALVAVRRV
jgi:hypothetical protein